VGVRLSVQAVPDSIPRDGASQATIVIEALTANGSPARFVVLRIDLLVNGGPVDLGTLSSRTVVTGDDGKVQLAYTAPPPSTALASADTTVTVRVTASGGDVRSDVSQQIGIKLLAASVRTPPTADFSYSPTTPTTFQDIVFSAAKSTAVGGRQIVSYAWNFGAGGSGGSGRDIVKAFGTPGSYVVALTVTDDAGEKSVTEKTVTVSALPGPTAVLSFSPATPNTSTTVFFDASASTTPSLATIASYSFNYGDGTSDGPAASPTQSHTFGATGIYLVRLTVTDSLGRTGTATVSVPVVAANPTAVLTFSPQDPKTGTTLFFDASGSSTPLPARVTAYAFNYGDGTGDGPGPSPNQTHVFAAAATYIVRLTITDSLGRTATTTATVIVKP
jgi:PKD repeat protein